MLRLGRIIGKATVTNQGRYVQTSAALSFVSRSSPSKGDVLNHGLRDGTKGHAWPSVDFRDTKEAYLSKSSSDVLRAYGVFRFCSYDVLMRYQKQLLSFSRRVLGRTLFKKVMRMTIYGQFMAGEERNEILESAEKHHKFGVRPMFAYTAAESHGHAEGMLGSGSQGELLDTNFEAMKECIEMAAQSPREEGEYIKISGKLTFLATAETYRSVTTLIDENTKVVHMARDKSKSEEKWKSVLLALQHVVTSHSEGSLTDVATKHGLPIPANYRELRWESLTTSLAFHLAASKSQELGNLLKDISIPHCILPGKIEVELLEAYSRLDYLSKRSSENGICLVLDAEQTYLQSAMDLMALDLMRIYNQTRPVVHNTYQCYLRRTYDVIQRDLESAEDEGFQLGAKVVRGGYMDEERMLAETHGYPDPVNPTFETTTAMYYKVAEELLQQIINGTKLQITFATHNEDTVKHILGLMSEYELSTDRNVLSFAQLLGMRDHVAFVLGRAGIPASKLLHYGPVEDCVAYLSRRISENKSGVPTANIERDMLSKELRRRWRTKVFG